MTKRTRRTHSPGFEAKAALAALKGEKTLAVLHQAGLAALQTPAATQRLAALGFETRGEGGEAFGTLLRETAGRFGAIAQQLGLRGGDA